MTDLVAFDFETTGLHPIMHRIVEIGAVRFSLDNGNKIIDTFQTFVNPGVAIPPEVIEIHNITDEMVKDAPSETEAIPKFLKFIGDSPLIAHNIKFDVSFLMASVATYKFQAAANLLIDSCALSQRCFKEAENHKLTTLGKLLKLEPEGFHRALRDSMAVMELYKKCLEKLGTKMSPEELAQQTTNKLTFKDYVFDKVDIPANKMALKEAVDKARTLVIRYRNGKGEEFRREISPFNIFCFRGKTYVAAHCAETDETRQFRMDRIQEVCS